MQHPVSPHTYAAWRVRGVDITPIRYDHKAVAIEYTESAGKHGYTPDDVMHAMRHPTLIVEAFDAPRVGTQAPVLVVGPAVGGEMIEVLYIIVPAERTVIVFHVLHLRERTWRRAQDVLQRRRIR